MEQKYKDINVEIKAESLSNTRTKVDIRDFSMIIDSAKSKNSEERFPTPLETFFASFAACINYTGQLIAKQKGLDVKNLKVKITGNYNPARLLGQETDERAGFKNIEVIISVEIPDATQQQIQEWIKEIEVRCPVSDNIINSTNVNFRTEILS